MVMFVVQLRWELRLYVIHRPLYWTLTTSGVLVLLPVLVLILTVHQALTSVILLIVRLILVKAMMLAN